MLTLFATPKPFTGEFAAIQRNAIHSWTLLRPACDIVLMGDEAGTAEAAAAFGARHIAAIERTSEGTPLISAIFARGGAAARTELLAYVNSDIVLMSDFTDAVAQVAARVSPFLMVGQRRGIRCDAALDFDGPWDVQLRRLVLESDASYPGIDYFVFTKDLWGEIPPFALGRAYWDNWPLYAARQRRAVVVDATPVVLAVHQDHAYYENQLQGAESQRNWQLLGGARNLLTTREATHMLTADGIKVRCRACYPVCVCAASFGAERVPGSGMVACQPRYRTIT